MALPPRRRRRPLPKATASSTEVDDSTAPAGHAAPPADQPTTATPGTSAAGEASATDGPQQSTPAGDAPSAPEAGTGAPAGTDAAAASLAADAARPDKA